MPFAQDVREQVERVSHNIPNAANMCVFLFSCDSRFWSLEVDGDDERGCLGIFVVVIRFTFGRPSFFHYVIPIAPKDLLKGMQMILNPRRTEIELLELLGLQQSKILA